VTVVPATARVLDLRGARLVPRAWKTVVLGACLLCLAGAIAPGRASAAGPVPLIVDTDIYSNADDVGALASAFALQMAGEANVLAVTVNTRTSRPAVATDSWKCVAAIANFYGFSQVPIGTDMPNNGGDSGSPYVGQCAQLAPASTPAPASAVTVMRQALASQPDGSVVIACIGYEENLAKLLQSPADSVGPNGAALVAQKVKMLVAMGGTYPSDSHGPENNLAGDPASAQYVSANWPTKLVWLGSEVGNVVFTGQTISSTHPANSPVRVAFEAYAGANQPVHSFDMSAVYHAVRSSDPVLSETGSGRNSIDGSGNNSFSTGSGNQFYLTLSDPAPLERSIEALLDKLPPPPGSGPPVSSGRPKVPLSLITRLSLRPSVFVAAPSGPSAVRSVSERKYGTVLSYRDSQPAITSIRLLKSVLGHRRGKSCVKGAGSKTHAKRCFVLVSIGYFTHQDVAGMNRFRFTGRIHGHRLAPGDYELEMVPHNVAGNGTMRSKSFRIVRK
jgi:inosine-uridine nucleoside N-ribohydrolase